MGKKWGNGENQKKGAIVDGKITFGKYSGSNIEDVPTEYLEWLVDARKDELKQFEEELKKRN